MTVLTRTDAKIPATFEVMAHLRAQLERDTYIAQVRQLMASDGFLLAYAVQDYLALAGPAGRPAAPPPGRFGADDGGGFAGLGRGGTLRAPLEGRAPRAPPALRLS